MSSILRSLGVRTALGSLRTTGRTVGVRYQSTTPVNEAVEDRQFNDADFEWLNQGPLIVSEPFRPNVGKPASYVLATTRSFPSLEPLAFQPVAADVLSLPVRRDLLWQAVVYERDAARVGSRHTKNRTEMGYSGKKLHAQKGTGRARVGDRGSPIRHDGGRAFGRKPNFDWSTGLPFQAYAKAMRTALSYLYAENKLLVVDGKADFITDHPKAGVQFMKSHDLLNKKVTVVAEEFPSNLDAATKDRFGNRMDIVTVEALNIRDLLKPDRLIIELDALKRLAIEYGAESPKSAISPETVPEIEEKLSRPLQV
ncbi:large ribosomal subunit protein uL4m [Trichomonascus vanleenenianus]|uniref:mitochondrial 54S ribosomal protein uL4m YML6 n=1 Tax=Trichomonascus vanleenenianus TaxID=2268995 RepID=UPI003ECA6821